MRTVRLARVALEAELLLLRRRIRHLATRAALGSIALAYLMAAFAVIHFVIYFALAIPFRPIYAALILFGIDMVIGLFFALLAGRSRTDSIEREARQIRDQARAEAMRSARTFGRVAPAARLLGKGQVYRMLLETALSRLRRR